MLYELLVCGLLLIICVWFFYKHCLDSLIVFIHRRLVLLKRRHRPHRIILIRHGESQGNTDTTIYARVPDSHIELTEAGVAQAINAGKHLKKTVICDESVFIYMSPYKRSKQTYKGIAQAFTDEQILGVREDPRLREQEWGNFADLSIREHELEEQKEVGDFFYRFKNGESGADVYDRGSLFMDTLFREMDKGYHSTQNILIVSHGLFIRLFLMRYFRWTVDKHKQLKNFDNCEWCVLEKNSAHGKYQLTTELTTK